jgi:hypothetical protein
VEQRSAARAAQQDALAEARLKIVEAESLRQQGDLMDAYFHLAATQDAPAALETYRSALASAREFEQTHAGLPAASRFLARASIQVGNLAPGEALDLFTDARSRLETIGETETADYFTAMEGLGRAQFRHHDLLASLASFSRGLQISERQSSSGGNKLDLAAANFWVGAVLAHNGENEAAAAKLRKAFELYCDIAGAHVNSPEETPAGYRKALEDLAGQTSPNLRRTIETLLNESGRV